jgi:alkanesulfonate monooxygenase SsuD/methylene tetrahydromethanopterin reductase-like flavin-dependent oxidoreductase (luciferase family)
MAAKPMHLGWFMNFTAGEWDSPMAVGGAPWDGMFYVDMAKALERACFDYIMIEDTLMVSEAYRGTAEATLKHGLQVPKHDPSPLAAIIAAMTRHLGVVATFSTLAYPPFMLARLCSTLDHIAGGRFGWNIVTSGEDAAAQNFGMDKLPPREQRYAMADEYVDVVCQLFNSWAEDAVVMDRETGTYADFRKVRPINFEGQFFKVRGPLNTVRSPQGRPVFVQAGGSPRGRAFAAKYADSIIAVANIGTVTDIDFSQFDLDQPLPHLTTNGEQGSLDKFAQWGSGKTLRQLAMERFGIPGSEVDFVGSPDTVAERMGQVAEVVGGDGFLISTPYQRASRHFIVEVTEGLVPALQRRGLARTAYTGGTLRQTLTEF